jgi:hypothetical protein
MDEEKLARRIDRFMIIYVLAASMLMLFQILGFYFSTQSDTGRNLAENWPGVINNISRIALAINLMNVITVGVFAFLLIVYRKTIRVGIIGLLAVGLFVFFMYLRLRLTIL